MPFRRRPARRKHQLRRHMALLGHPLVGDPRYTFGYIAAREAAGLPLPAEGHQPLAPAGAGDVAAGAAATEAQAAAAVAAPCSGKSGAGLPAVVQAATAAHGLKLCLWAVELHLERHPTSGEPMHFAIPEPSAFEEVRSKLAGGAPSM